jgi:CrcB protein
MTSPVSRPAGAAGPGPVVEVADMPRAAHLSPAAVALVAAGGAVGSGARYTVAQLLPTVAGWPRATFVVNLVGAFALGVLLETLISRGPESVRLRRWRLALGTGVLGGFTTFSSLALEVEGLVAAGRPVLGATYGLVSVVAGAVLAFAGVAVAAGVTRRRSVRPPVDPDAGRVDEAQVRPGRR